MDIGHRHEFGKDWDDVIKNWGDGNTLPISSEQGWEALGVLEQYWPEYLGEVLASGEKGIYSLAQVIDTGLVLAACQQLTGFAQVLENLKKKQREQETLAELRFASALVELGYMPLLSQARRNKNLDAIIVSEGTEVCIEVAMPKMSNKMKKAWDETKVIADRLLERLSQNNKDFNVEIFLLSDSPGIAIANDIFTFLASSPLPAPETVHVLPGLASLVYSETLTSISLREAVPRDETRLMLGYSATNTSGNSIRVSCAVSDKRLEQIWSHEKKQVFREDINLLVIDISRIPNGFKEWTAFIRGQMRRSRRFGGVLLVLYIPGRIGTFSRGYDLVRHTNPRKELPKSFVEDLLRLKDLTYSE